MTTGHLKSGGSFFRAQTGMIGEDRPLSPPEQGEVVLGLVAGIVFLYYSWKGLLPAAIFVPDGVLSIIAALALGDRHRKAARLLGIVAVALAMVGFALLFYRQMA
jgi:hypothetical protein